MGTESAGLGIEATGETLLDYALQLDPDPLQVGQTATLTLVVSNPGRHPVSVTSIVLTMPVGTAAKDLTADATGLQISQPTGWDADQEGGTITFHAQGGAQVGDDGLGFVIAWLVVNGQPGTTTLAIDETAGADGAAPVTRSAEIELPKFTAGFILSDLNASGYEVPECGTVTLMWSGSAPPDDAVSYTLQYQPSPDDSTVSVAVGHRGPYTSVALTRSDEVTFTLIAQVNVPGLDEPQSYQRQVTVTMVPLIASIEPTTVGARGLVRLTWIAPNADHCSLEDGSVLPVSGSCYLVVAASRAIAISAAGLDGKVRQRHLSVTVDPAITATEAGYVISGSAGGNGGNGSNCNAWFHNGCNPSAGDGGAGGDATLTGSLPALDTSGRPQRVIPISLAGGPGGNGGHGGSMTATDGGQFASPGGSGGRGGNAVLNITLNAPDPIPAQYLVTLAAGGGGVGGWSGTDWIALPSQAPGGSGGVISRTIDGLSVHDS